MGNIEIQKNIKYKGKFAPREAHDGQPIKPELEKFIGNIFIFEPLWICEENERYTGEWAMGCKSKELSDIVTWIASGDIKIIEEVKH